MISKLVHAIIFLVSSKESEFTITSHVQPYNKKIGRSHAAAQSIQSRFCNDAGENTHAASNSESTFQETIETFCFLTSSF
jgi:hypothetical protein